MSLILYPATEKTFDNNGLGALSDAIDAEVCEELNGQFELMLHYPVSGIHFPEIAAECYITAKPNPVSKPQPFRIYRITKPMGGIVTIYARHIAYRLSKFVTSLVIADTPAGAFAQMKANAVPECPFDFWTDVPVNGNLFAVINPTDMWTALGSGEWMMLDVFGGEYEFDGFTVKLHKRRGADRGVSIRYGKNLRSFQMDENVAGVYTGVYPYWNGSDGPMVTLPEKYLVAEGDFPEEKILPLDLTDQFEEQPTEEQLREAAILYMVTHEIGKPEISITVDFAMLGQTEEYKDQAQLEQVELGDTVHVYFPQLKVEASARAVAARYRPLLGRYKNITLGRVKATLASTVAQSKLEIGRIERSGSLQAAVDKATSWLTGGKGNLAAIRDDNGAWKELLILETPDIKTAEKVFKWDGSGFSFSSTGYKGEFRQVLTQEGKLISADGSICVDLMNNEITLDGKKLGWLSQGGNNFLVGLDE